MATALLATTPLLAPNGTTDCEVSAPKGGGFVLYGYTYSYQQLTRVDYQTPSAAERPLEPASARTYRRLGRGIGSAWTTGPLQMTPPRLFGKVRRGSQTGGPHQT